MMSKITFWKVGLGLIACLCSIALTYLTVTPPLVSGEWSYMNWKSVYIPPQVDYAWTPYIWQLILWMILVSACLLITRPISLRRQFTKKANLGFLLVLTFIGFGLRLHSWNTFPLLVDEIGFAAHASDIVHGQHSPLLAPGHNGNPALYSAMLAFSMRLLGQNLLAIRIVPVIFGTLTIPAIYAFGKTWWSPRVGLLGALVITFFPAHVFFSRLSLYNSVEPFFSLLALTQLHRAIWKKSLSSFTLAAIHAGIAQYLYHGSRLTLVLMGIYILLNFRRDLLKPLLWMVFVLGLLLVPLFASLAVHNLPISGNSNTLRLPDDFNHNFWRAGLAWVGQPDHSPFWLGSSPFLPALMMILFWGGVVVSLKRWHDSRSAILILSLILTTIFGGFLLTAAPLYVRYITALPAVIMLVAITINQFPKAIQTVLVMLICFQGLGVIEHHEKEVIANVSPSQWQTADLAQQAAKLPAENAVLIMLPADFDTVQKITLGDYMAVYGQRRRVSIGKNLPQPLSILTVKNQD